MPDPVDLEKLFDAAVHERKAPSRFGTPEDQRIAAPAAFQRAGTAPSTSPFQKADAASPFTAVTTDAKPFAAAANVFQAAPSTSPSGPEVVLDQHGKASLDSNLNAELEAILDKKIAKEKSRKHRDRLFVLGALIAVVGGGIGWLVTHPDKMEELKKVVSDIRTGTDPNAIADQYKKSLDKVAKHGNQLDSATEMIGGEAPPAGSEADQSMDKEMKEVAGDGAGLSASEKQKLLQEKLDAIKKKSGGK